MVSWRFRSSRGGRLSPLFKATAKGNPRSWCFADFSSWKNQDGDELFDVVRRGVMVGSLEEGRKFLRLLNDLGLSSEEWVYVPFSNGQPLVATVREQRYGSPRLSQGEREKRHLSAYWMDELIIARLDLPTEEQLRQIVAD